MTMLVNLVWWDAAVVLEKNEAAPEKDKLG
jgi:hypothetical protein